MTPARTSGGIVLVHAIAVDLARADGPAPDIDLALAVHVAQEDAGVAVGEAELDLLARDVAGVGAVGQDVGDIGVDEGGFLDAPIEPQDEVAELAGW